MSFIFCELTGMEKYYTKEMGFLCDLNQVLYLLNSQDCLFPVISEWLIPKHSLLSWPTA